MDTSRKIASDAGIAPQGIPDDVWQPRHASVIEFPPNRSGILHIHCAWENGDQETNALSVAEDLGTTAAQYAEDTVVVTHCARCLADLMRTFPHWTVAINKEYLRARSDAHAECRRFAQKTVNLLKERS